MVRVGFCTISFQKFPVDEALAMAAEADARGVEVWGRDHLPADAPAADYARVRQLAETHGLEIAAYGSYLRAGSDEWTDARVAGVLDKVAELGTSTVRVWPGTKGSADATPEDWERVTDELKRWGDLAAERGQIIVLERHCNTLTDYANYAKQLIDRVSHPAVWLNYQVPYPWPAENFRTQLTEDLCLHLPVSRHIHVQNYREDNGALPRTYIAEGIVDYAAWPSLLREAGFDGWAVIEFLPDVPAASPVELARGELASLRRLLQAE